MSVAALLLLVLAGGIALAGCGGVSAGATGDGVRVVAAENFWGSIARQVGGTHVTVQSIIVNPAQDPHSYEPSSADARTMAEAQLAIVNGIGYDPWAPKLMAANPVDGRRVVTVGARFGLHEGDNPHRWYDPQEVEAVAGAIAKTLTKLDPNQGRYFAAGLRTFETQGLGQYHALIAQIRRRYAGVAVGASESIFALQAPALGLNLITPTGLMKAVSEGTDITARDASRAESQITAGKIKVWIYNTQNQTPEVQHLSSLARSHHVPILTITETLTPATASFEQWQTEQLERLASALHRATGR